MASYDRPIDLDLLDGELAKHGGDVTDGRAHDEEIDRAHQAAIAAGEPGYLDPETGFFVFTAASLLANGSCCESGCRHCPYGYPRE